MYTRDIKPFKEDNKTEKTITFFSVLFDSHDIDDE